MSATATPPGPAVPLPPECGIPPVSNPPVRPRLARPGDAPELARLRRLMFAAMGRPVANPAAWDRTCARRITELLTTPAGERRLVAVVVDDDRAAGQLAAAMAELVDRLRVRMASSEQPVASLSGGNQQKVSLISSFLRGDVKVILAEEPTQGVDVGARFDIYEALRAKSEEGVAAVVKSSDPLELSGLCDRVVVMSRGRIVEEIPRHELGERRIVEAIVGARAGKRT